MVGAETERHIMTRPVALGDLADSILYLASLLGDQPRPIDRHIDYFGGATCSWDGAGDRLRGAAPAAARA